MAVEPALELKYYNSISDFDYRIFPNPNKPPKKLSISTYTQTELNFIINDFKILKKPPIVTTGPAEEANRMEEEMAERHKLGDRIVV